MPEDVNSSPLPVEPKIADNTAPSTAAEPPIQLGALDPASPDGMAKQETLVADMQKLYSAWAAHRAPFENLWGEIYAAFMSVLRGQKVFTRARVFVPVVFQAVQAAVPKIVNIVVGQSPFFEVHAEKKEDTSLAEIIRKILSFQLFKADFFVKFVEFVIQLVLYGTSYFYVYWKVRRAWVVKRQTTRTMKSFFGIPIGWETSTTRTRVYDVVERRPEVDVLDIADVYADPDARTEDEGRGFFIRTRMSVADVKEMGGGQFPVFANTDKVQGSSGASAAATAVKQTRAGVRGTSSASPVTTPGDGFVDILTFWGSYDLDGDGIREEVVIVFCGGNVLLQAKANPFDHQKRPLVRAILFLVPKEWYGMGLVEPVLPLVAELNTLRNQALDVNNLIINRMWKVNSTADIDITTLVSVPNGVVLTDMMDGLIPLEQQELPSSVYTDGAMIQRDIENTAAPRSVQGTPESGALGRTARGAQLIISQALEKFGLAAKLVEEQAVKRVLHLFHQLNQQFLPEDDAWGPDGFYGPVYSPAVEPEQLRADMRFTMLGVDETINKEGKINQGISFATVFKGVPGINLLGVAKAIAQWMDFGVAVDEIVGPAPFPQMMVNNTGSLAPQGGDNPASVANQVAANGASVPAALPGMKSA